MTAASYDRQSRIEDLAVALRRPIRLTVALALSLAAALPHPRQAVAADPPAPAPVHVWIYIPALSGVTLPSYTADFEIRLDCGSAGTFTETATGTTIPIAPGPAKPATFAGIPLNTFCTISQGPLPAPPDGFAWADPIFSSEKVTIQATDVDVVIQDPLVPRGLWVRKEAANDPDGPFNDWSVVTFTGRRVYFRITVENVGDVPLTGVTLT